MGRVVLDEWHVRVEMDEQVRDPTASAVIERFAELIADAARSIEDDLRAVGGLTVRIVTER